MVVDVYCQVTRRPHQHSLQLSGPTLPHGPGLPRVSSWSAALALYSVCIPSWPFFFVLGMLDLASLCYPLFSNDECVSGGKHFLLDAYPLLLEMRKNQPQLFDTLTRLPGTFQKIHFDRCVRAPVILDCLPTIAIMSSIIAGSLQKCTR